MCEPRGVNIIMKNVFFTLCVSSMSQIVTFVNVFAYFVWNMSFYDVNIVHWSSKPHFCMFFDAFRLRSSVPSVIEKLCWLPGLSKYRWECHNCSE